MTRFKKDQKTHEEWDKIIIKSSEGKNRYYRVFIGTVLWQDGLLRKACVVFVQYGNTEDWKKACSNREIAFDEPAHILINDYDKVNSAIQELIKKYS
ncbi:hypothetical protein V4483_15590 [Bacillus paranthracis]|uniref:hypothetical protein n=1 Tax=Bacillus paranthracis TaxID=2026186 RepID=UPI002FCDB42C